MRKLDKLDKEIFEIIHKDFGEKPIMPFKFFHNYMGNLMFIYHDRYGLPLSAMLPTLKKTCEELANMNEQEILDEANNRARISSLSKVFN